MKLKPEVQYKGAQRQIWYALGVADVLHRLHFDEEVVVTAMLDGKHNTGSLHPKGYAADIRIKDLTDVQAAAYLSELKSMLERYGFDIVFEGGVGATPATTGSHIHIEFDPKGDERFEQVLA